MVKVVEGGQFAASRARFSPGVRTGLHVVAAEATDTPRPIAIETARTSKSFFTFPLLLRCSPYKDSTINSSTRQRSDPGSVRLRPHAFVHRFLLCAWAFRSPMCDPGAKLAHSTTGMMPVAQVWCELLKTLSRRS